MGGKLDKKQDIYMVSKYLPINCLLEKGKQQLSHTNGKIKAGITAKSTREHTPDERP